MRRVAKIFIWCSLIPICLILIVLLTVSAYGAFLYFQADVKQPELELLASDYTLSHHTDSLKVCGSNSLLKNKFGLWETI